MRLCVSLLKPRGHARRSAPQGGWWESARQSPPGVLPPWGAGRMGAAGSRRGQGEPPGRQRPGRERAAPLRAGRGETGCCRCCRTDGAPTAPPPRPARGQGARGLRDRRGQDDGGVFAKVVPILCTVAGCSRVVRQTSFGGGRRCGDPGVPSGQAHPKASVLAVLGGTQTPGAQRTGPRAPEGAFTPIALHHLAPPGSSGSEASRGVKAQARARGKRRPSAPGVQGPAHKGHVFGVWNRRTVPVAQAAHHHARVRGTKNSVQAL